MRTALLVLVCLSLIFSTASAQGIVVPGDADGDMIVSDEELEQAEKSFDEGKITSEQLEEIRHIHDHYPITIVDSANRTVTIYKPVDSIIPMVTWSYEPVWLLGAQDKVVGVTTDAQDTEYPWFDGIEDKPAIGTYKELDYEKVADLHPQLLIVGPALIVKRVDVEKLESLGISVVALSFNNQETFDTEFRTLAKILEEDELAEDFLSWKNGHLDQIKENVLGIDRKVRVYGEWTYSQWCTSVAGSSGLHSLIITSGGENIAGNLSISEGSTVLYVDPEWVFKENPEVVIFSAFGDYTGYTKDSYENAEQFVSEAYNRIGLKDTDAARNSKIYLIDGKCVETVRGFIGDYYLSKWLYPEKFEDLDLEDIESIHKEYFEEWLGVPYQGIWAYPLASA